MSIYALPGPLFKLISSGIHPLKSNDNPEGVKEGMGLGSDELSSSADRTDLANNPLHHKASGECTSSSSSASDLQGNSGVVIAVKEAKIDAERLIKSLTSKPDPKRTASKNFTPASDVSEDSGHASSTSSSSPRRRRRSKKGASVEDASGALRKCDPHEEAINIDISVSFNGREYTATRTLPRILQFRCDLIEEFRARRKHRERRKKKNVSKPPKMKELKHQSDDEDEDDVDSFKEDDIPELPRLSDGSSGHSTNQSHGGGFAMLNALLRPYGPALERWLRNVIDVVPHDSQCLTQFLWEPLSGQATNRKFERRSSSMSTLGAIQETDDLDQYDSDTDEYMIHC